MICFFSLTYSSAESYEESDRHAATYEHSDRISYAVVNGVGGIPRQRRREGISPGSRERSVDLRGRVLRIRTQDGRSLRGAGWLDSRAIGRHQRSRALRPVHRSHSGGRAYRDVSNQTRVSIYFRWPNAECASDDIQRSPPRIPIPIWYIAPASSRVAADASSVFVKRVRASVPMATMSSFSI